MRFHSGRNFNINHISNTKAPLVSIDHPPCCSTPLSKYLPYPLQPYKYSDRILNRTFRNLPQRTRVGVGLAFLAWGTTGLYISDNAAKKLGFEPSPKDKEALQAAAPRIMVVEREGKS
jgi:hypothetical protein